MKRPADKAPLDEAHAQLEEARRSVRRAEINQAMRRLWSNQRRMSGTSAADEIFFRRLTLPPIQGARMASVAHEAPECAKLLRKKWHVTELTVVEPVPRLASEPVKQRILRAAEENDVAFFVRLAEVLSGEPKNPFQECGPLESFLFRHWAEDRDGVPMLCCLTRLQGWNRCREFLGPNMTEGAFSKTIDRLQLVRVSKAHARLIRPA